MRLLGGLTASTGQQPMYPKWIWEGVKRTRMTDEGQRCAEWVDDEAEWLTRDEMWYVSELYVRMESPCSLDAAIYDVGPPPPRLVHRARRQGDPWQDQHVHLPFDDSPLYRHVGHSDLHGPGGVRGIPHPFCFQPTAPFERAVIRALRAHDADPSDNNRALVRLHLAALDHVLAERSVLAELGESPCL